MKLFGYDDHFYVWKKNAVLTVKRGGDSIMTWGCSVTGRPGTLHQIDFMRKEDSVDILKQHLKASIFKWTRTSNGPPD